VQSPAFCATTWLTAFQGVLLHALEGGPQAFAQVFWPAGFDQLLGGHRGGWLALASLTLAQ
jgi:hypothetical protein